MSPGVRLLFCIYNFYFLLSSVKNDAIGNNYLKYFNNLHREKASGSTSVLHFHEDLSLNVTQLIRKNKYPVEEYKVITADGYHLKIFRIPGAGPVVFLMHGIFSSADDWVTGGVKSGLAYLLANQGYDVWIGNTRGNKYCKSHVTLEPSEKAFWDFSFHEIGLFDLPAMIDLVLEKTNTTSLAYIGHSQGTTVFFVMCSLIPEYNDKIRIMLAFSAVAWLSHTFSPPTRLSAFTLTKILPLLEKFSLRKYELVSETEAKKLFFKVLCGNKISAFYNCQLPSYVIVGFSYNQTNFEQLPVIFNHFPTSSSEKQFTHFGQLLESGYFRQYDFGREINKEKYGSLMPPSYPVEKITASVAIFHSDGDWISSLTDVKILISKLPNVVDFYTIPNKSFNHLDFLYAKDLIFLIMPKVLELLDKYA